MVTKTTTKQTTKASTKSTKKPTNSASTSTHEPAPHSSALDAAARVLAEVKKPLNCAALIKTMAEKGYWTSPKGKTPSATLYASMTKEIQTKGKQARFAKASPGHFTLA